MVGSEVGSAFATIKLDDSALDSGLNATKGKFSSALNSMESGAVKTGKAIGTALVTATAAIGVALAGAATLGTKYYMDIESSAADAASKMDLSAIAQKSGKSMEESFVGVKDHVIALSRELGQLNTNAFDPTEIAAACANLAAGGFDVATASAKDLSPMLALATATSYDLGGSVQVATDTMSQYGMGISDLGMISDVLVQACGDSKLGMEDLSYAMSYAGPSAKAAGVSFKSTVAALETFSQSGIRGEKAGTALVDVMNTLVGPTGTQSKALAELGVNLKDIDPRTHEFADVLGTLKQKADASGDGLNAFIKIFGVRGGLIYGLAGATNEMDGFEKKLDSSQGAAERMAQFMLNTLSGSFDAAMGAATDLAIGIGQDLAPTIKGLLDWFSSDGAPAVRELYEAFKEGDWGKIGDTISDAVHAGWDKLKDMGKSLFDKIKNVNWGGLGSYVTKGIKSAWNELSSLGGQLLGWIRGIDFGSVGTTIACAFAGIGKYIYDSIANINWGTIASMATESFKNVSSFFGGIGKSIYDAISKVDWSSIGTSVLASLKGIGSQITTIFSGIKFGDIGRGILDSLSDIGGKILGYFDNIKWASVGKALADGVKSGIQSLTGIANQIAELFTKHSWDGVGSDIGNKIKDAIGHVSGWLDKVIDGVKASVSGWGDVGTKAGTAIKNAIGAIKDYASGIYTSIKTGIQSWIDGGSAGKIGAYAMDAIAAGFALCATISSSIASLFTWDNLMELVDWAVMGINAIEAFAKGFISEGVALGANLAASILDGLAEGIRDSKMWGAEEVATTIAGSATALRAQGLSTKNKYTGGASTLSDYTNPDKVKAVEAARSIDAEGNVFEYGKLTGNIFKAEEEQGKKLAEEDKKLRIATAKQEAEIISNTLESANLSYGTIQTLFEQKYGAGGKPWVWDQPTEAQKPSASLSLSAHTTNEPRVSLSGGAGSASGFQAVAELMAKNGYGQEEIISQLKDWANAQPGYVALNIDEIKAGFKTGADVWAKTGKESALIAAQVNFESTKASADFIYQMLDEGKIVFENGAWQWAEGVAETVKVENAAAIQNANIATTAAKQAAEPVKEATLSFRQQIWKTVTDTDQMWRNTNEIIKYGIDEQGKKTAIIGTVAQQNWAAGGKAFVDGTTTAGTTFGAAIGTTGDGLSAKLTTSTDNLGTTLTNSALQQQTAAEIANANMQQGGQASAQGGITAGLAMSTGADGITEATDNLSGALGTAAGSFAAMLQYSNLGNGKFDNGGIFNKLSTGGSAIGPIGSAVQTFNDCMFEGFTDSCTNMNINALKYTSPSGVVQYINPMDNAAVRTLSPTVAPASTVTTAGKTAGTTVFGTPTHSAEFNSWGKYAKGGNPSKPTLALLAEKGEEMVLPNDITVGLKSMIASGSTGGQKIIVEPAPIYLDGRKIADILMTAVVAKARAKGFGQH